MTGDANERGKALEDAVEAIERAILTSAPSLQGHPFRITSRRTVEVAGVKHEIDLWIEVEIAPQFPALFIFECKNWKDAVGKNEVIIFTEKVRAVGASKGYLVARSFTGSAASQAALEPRIELLLAEQVDPSVVLTVLNFHIVGFDVKDHHARFSQGDGCTNLCDIDVDHAIATLNGKRIELRPHILLLGKQVMDAFDETFPSGVMEPGRYPLTAFGRIECTPDELVVDGMRMAHVDIRVGIEAHVARPQLRCAFDVKTHGLAMAYEPASMIDVTFQATFVMH